MTQKIPSAEVRLRSLEFDAQTRITDSAGRKTLLDARSSGVLLALAERFGDVVSKDALLRAGWPTQLVHENSLAKAISKLRQAIQGSGVEIVAIYGVGYSLREAENPRVVAKPASPEAPAAIVERSRAAPRRLLTLSMCLLLLTAVIGSFIEGRLAEIIPIRHTAPITNDAPGAIATVLWVDDHPSNNTLEVKALRQRRVAVHLAVSTEDALKLLAINRYKLVVSDLGRGEDRLAGLRMIDTMRQHRTNVPVIIYTLRPKDRSGHEALRRFVARAGAVGLAVTPQEVRAAILRTVAPDA